MRIHQVHFLAYLEDERALLDPEWLDTITVLVGGSVDVIIDFTDDRSRADSREWWSTKRQWRCRIG
jgi:hypothetical protein